MNQDELMHFGVKGMKWGKRKAAPTASQTRISNAKSAYKTAKTDYKNSIKDYRRSGHGIGINAIERSKKAESNMHKSEMNMIDAKAKYKAAKAKSADKAEKAEFKTYRKEMQKTGLAGSAADTANGGRSTRLYNEIKAKKGKEYADKVQKKVQNVAVTELAAASVVTIGAAAVNAYLMNKS